MLGNSNWKVYREDGTVDPVVKSEGEFHEANFLDCVKSRKLPNSDIEIGRLSTMLCHLGNVSYKLGRDVRFDGASETFGTDHEANGRLTKSYRKGFELPNL